jgi:hypothetical protein
MMAGQEPGPGFTGSFHNISACKRGDMDTIIRSKGGTSKKDDQTTLPLS